MFLGIGAALFVTYLWMSRQRGLPPVGVGVRAKWYPVFVVALWAAAVLICLFTAATPHLRRLTWVILIIALAVHSLVNSVVAYAERGGEA